MSEIYIARQPIFDEDRNLYGYELLYRKSKNNYYEGVDDDQATAELLDNFFSFGFLKLIDNTRGFVNFSSKLLKKEAALILPPDKLVIEILERAEIDDGVLEACRKLKEEGYTIALDDFAFCRESSYSQLLKYVDIIKMECGETSDMQKATLVKKLGQRITFIAERVETEEDFRHAKELGFKLFQGYYFSKPIMINAKAIGALTNNLLPIMSKLRAPEPDYDSIAELFEKDVELSYKLLRLINSAYYGARYVIKSIRHALVHIGVQGLARWVNLMLVKGLQSSDNAELVKTSLIRGKMLSLFAESTGKLDMEPDYFITGIFSSIDMLLGEPMRQIVGRLPLSDATKDALLGENNFIRRPLNAIMSLEKADWDNVDAFLAVEKISVSDFMSLYMQAVSWEQAASGDAEDPKVNGACL